MLPLEPASQTGHSLFSVGRAPTTATKRAVRAMSLAKNCMARLWEQEGGVLCRSWCSWVNQWVDATALEGLYLR